ncbi:MAG: histidine kinase [bacterium]|nr:histidine kinase [bacterium]
MTAINVTLDIYSALVCMILCGSLFSAQGKKARLRLYFLLMCMFNFGMALGDIPSWTCSGFTRSWYPVAQWIGALVFWLCSTGMLLFFTAYLIEYLSPKVHVHRVFWHVALVLGGMHIAGVLLSVGNGMFFTITAENVYQRGDWFWFSQLLPLLIYVLDIVIFAFYHQVLSMRDFHILSSYIALPLVCELIQMTHFGVSLLPAGVSVSLLLIYINIQSEQELRLERQEKELAEARIDIMLSQIQPHFLYNSLTAIRQLCDENPAQAKETIHDFAQFLRGNMNSLKSKAPIPFEQELSHVENYLALEQQRFQGRLHVNYEIKIRNFSIPPLTIQPIVENAVRHGILKREAGGTVTIQTKENDMAYLVIVEDDGVGMQPVMQNDHEHMHIGIENVRERLAAICAGTLTFYSVPDKGTTVVITIPKEDRS